MPNTESMQVTCTGPKNTGEKITVTLDPAGRLVSTCPKRSVCTSPGCFIATCHNVDPKQPQFTRSCIYNTG